MDTIKPAGSGFLKVTGILMIVTGPISIILGLITFMGISFLVELASSLAQMNGTTVSQELAQQGLSLSLLYVSVALITIGGIVQLVSGIIGVKNANKPEKAALCKKAGIVVIIMLVLGNVLSVVSGGGLQIVSLLIGLIIPGLFIYGAMKNGR